MLLHVNDLEHLARAGAQAAADLMLAVRDAFLLPHAHWVFVGANDIDQRIFRVHDQVGSIIPISLTLEPLGGARVRELVEKRYAHLAVADRPLVAPVDLDAVEPLYARYRGDLRSFLSLLSQAAQYGVVRSGGVAATLGVADVVAIMAPRMRRAVLTLLTEADLSYLDIAVSGRAVDTEFRVVDLVRATGINQASTSTLVERLLRAGVIAEHRRDGRNRYYQLSHGPTTVALGMV